MLAVISLVLCGRRPKIQIDVEAGLDQDNEDYGDLEERQAVTGVLFSCDQLCSTLIFDVYKLLRGNLNCHCAPQRQRLREGTHEDK